MLYSLLHRLLMGESPAGMQAFTVLLVNCSVRVCVCGGHVLVSPLLNSFSRSIIGIDPPPEDRNLNSSFYFLLGRGSTSRRKDISLSFSLSLSLSLSLFLV